MTGPGRRRTLRANELTLLHVAELQAIRELIDARTLPAAKRCVEILLGCGYGWAPLGGKEANFGLVNIGSDPGIAFVERVTNAPDVMLGPRALHADAALLAVLDSPRDASRELFGIPEGRLSKLDAAARTALALNTTVRVGSGTRVDRPTLEVRDYGIGLTPTQMPKTILNLAGSNKLGKPYSRCFFDAQCRGAAGRR